MERCLRQDAGAGRAAGPLQGFAGQRRVRHAEGAVGDQRRAAAGGAPGGVCQPAGRRGHAGGGGAGAPPAGSGTADDDRREDGLGGSRDRRPRSGQSGFLPRKQRGAEAALRFLSEEHAAQRVTHLGIGGGSGPCRHRQRAVPAEQRLPATGRCRVAVSDHRVVRWPEGASGSGGLHEASRGTLAKRSQGRVRRVLGRLEGLRRNDGREPGDTGHGRRVHGQVAPLRGRARRGPLLGQHAAAGLQNAGGADQRRAADAAPLPAAAQASARDRR